MLACRKDLAGAQEAIAPQVEIHEVVPEPFEPPDLAEDFQRLGHHLRADTITGNHTKLDQNALRARGTKACNDCAEAKVTKSPGVRRIDARPV